MIFQFDKTKTHFFGLNTALSESRKRFKELIPAMQEYNALAASDRNGFAHTIRETNSSFDAYLTSLNGTRASLSGYIAYTAKAAASTVLFKAATLALNMALAMGVSALFSWVAKLVSAQEEARKAALESAKAFQQEKEALNEYKDKIAELKTELDSGNLSHQEAYDKRKELLSIQDEIISKYGSEAGAIDLVNGSLKDQIGLIDKVTALEARKNLNKNKSQYDKAVNEMEKVRNFRSKNIVISEGARDIGLYDLLQSFENRGLSTTAGGDGSVIISLEADASKAEKVLNDLGSELQKLAIQFPNDSDLLDGLQRYVEDNLRKVEKITEKYGTLYDEQALNRILANINRAEGSGGLGDYWNTAKESLQQYQKAVSQGLSENEINDSIDNMYQALQNALNASSNDPSVQKQFKDLFDNVQTVLDNRGKASHKILCR